MIFKFFILILEKRHKLLEPLKHLAVQILIIHELWRIEYTF